MGQGAQDNESAIEQAKDEQISDYSKCDCVLTLIFVLMSTKFEDNTSQRQAAICPSRIRRLDLVKHDWTGYD